MCNVDNPQIRARPRPTDSASLAFSSWTVFARIVENISHFVFRDLMAVDMRFAGPRARIETYVHLPRMIPDGLRRNY